MKNSFCVSILKKISNFLEPDENNINKNFESSFWIKLLKAVKKPFTNELIQNSFLVKNLSNIFFIIFIALIFAIPYTSTGIIGAISTVLIFAGVIKFLTEKKSKLSSFHIPVLAYLAIITISVTFSSLLMPSIKGFSKILIYIGLYFSFFEFFKHDINKIKLALWAIVLSASTEILFCMKQNILGTEALATWQDKTNVNPEDLLNRIYGTLKPNNPNLLAGYLLAIIPVCFSSAFLFLNDKKYIKSGFSAIIGFLSLYSIILTGSRGAYIAVFAMFITLICLSFNKIKKLMNENPTIKRIVIYGSIIALFGVIYFITSSSAIQHRLESIFTLRNDSSNSYRMNVYLSTIKMFLDNPIIGIGVGNTTFRLTYGLYMVTGYDALGAYCIYLEILAESGIFALLAFFWLIFLSFKRFFRTFLSNCSTELKIIAFAAIFGIIGMLVHGIVDTIWYRPQVQILFWLYVAILAIVTSDRLSKKDE